MESEAKKAYFNRHTANAFKAVYEDLALTLNARLLPFLEVVGMAKEEAVSKYFEVRNANDFDKFKIFLYLAFVGKIDSSYLSITRCTKIFESLTDKFCFDSLFFPGLDLSFIEYKNGVFTINQTRIHEASEKEYTPEEIEEIEKVNKAIDSINETVGGVLSRGKVSLMFSRVSGGFVRMPEESKILELVKNKK